MSNGEKCVICGQLIRDWEWPKTPRRKRWWRKQGLEPYHFCSWCTMRRRHPENTYAAFDETLCSHMHVVITKLENVYEESVGDGITRWYLTALIEILKKTKYRDYDRVFPGLNKELLRCYPHLREHMEEFATTAPQSGAMEV